MAGASPAGRPDARHCDRQVAGCPFRTRLIRSDPGERRTMAKTTRKQHHRPAIAAPVARRRTRAPCASRTCWRAATSTTRCSKAMSSRCRRCACRPDLKLATCFVMPLGGGDDAVIEALNAQQALYPRRDRASGQPEIRARHPLPRRRGSTKPSASSSCSTPTGAADILKQPLRLRAGRAASPNRDLGPSRQRRTSDD